MMDCPSSTGRGETYSLGCLCFGRIYFFTVGPEGCWWEWCQAHLRVGFIGRGGKSLRMNHYKMEAIACDTYSRIWDLLWLFMVLEMDPRAVSHLLSSHSKVSEATSCWTGIRFAFSVSRKQNRTEKSLGSIRKSVSGTETRSFSRGCLS